MSGLGQAVTAFFITTRGLGLGFITTAGGAPGVRGTLVKLPIVRSVPPGGVKRDSPADIGDSWRPRGGVRG